MADDCFKVTRATEGRETIAINMDAPLPSMHTMLEVGLCLEVGQTTLTLNEGEHAYGRIHATMNGRCVLVPAEIFWPWAAGLVGVTITGEYSPLAYSPLMDFDQMEYATADKVVGMHVYHSNSADWKVIREVSLSVGEFWDALCALENRA